MSLIKDLKSKTENTVNIVDVASLVCPKDKSKYVDLLLRIMGSTENANDYKNILMNNLKKDFNISTDETKNFTCIQLIIIDKFFRELFDAKDLKNFIKFCEYNERGLIEDNDLSRLNKFEPLVKLVEQAEARIIEKEMEKQVIKIYEDSEWLVLKPLTYESSKKYGAGTKWCTTSEGDSSHFNRYGKGMLIYCIDKKSKVACYKDLGGSEFSFWNQIDNKIESLDSDLSMEALKAIRDHVKTCKTGNISLYKESSSIIKL